MAWESSVKYARTNAGFFLFLQFKEDTLISAASPWLVLKPWWVWPQNISRGWKFQPSLNRTRTSSGSSECLYMGKCYMSVGCGTLNWHSLYFFILSSTHIRDFIAAIHCQHPSPAMAILFMITKVTPFLEAFVTAWNPWIKAQIHVCPKQIWI